MGRLPFEPPALAQPQGVVVPHNDGWVTDVADVLDAAQENALEAELARFREQTKHDVAVLTIPSLGERTIEEYGLAVAREWKLGQVDQHDGALLLLAVGDRQLRIEVGRGLEGELTDATCARIVRDAIVPQLKRGDTYAAIDGGVRAIEAAITGEAPAVARAAPRGAARTVVHGFELLPALFAVVILGLALLRVFLRIRRGGGPRRRRRGFGSWHDPFGGFGGGGFGGGFGGGSSGGGFSGFGGGGGFSGGGASGRW